MVMVVVNARCAWRHTTKFARKNARRPNIKSCERKSAAACAHKEKQKDFFEEKLHLHSSAHHTGLYVQSYSSSGIGNCLCRDKPLRSPLSKFQVCDSYAVSSIARDPSPPHAHFTTTCGAIYPAAARCAVQPSSAAEYDQLRLFLWRR